jgi:hypothetical protein
MPTPTYDLIASNVLGSSASSVTFSSIPATYRDLVVVVKADGANQNALIRLNSDTTGSNYSPVSMYGTGSSAFSSTIGQNTITYDVAADTNYLAIINIMDYSATDKHKTMLNRANNPTGSAPAVGASAIRWANTSAVNTVTILISAGSWAVGSSFYLYGLVG